MRQLTLLYLLGVLLGACASLPHSVTDRDPITTLSSPQDFQASQSHTSQIIDGLLDVFKDDTLSMLVQQSLAHNLDIQLAAQQLREAGFSADAQWGNLLPKVLGKHAGNRIQGSRGSTTSTYSPSLDVSWELDLWGKVRDRKNALHATALAQAENYQAIRDSIAAQTMQGWFAVVTAEKLIVLEQSRLDNLEKSAASNRRNYRAGLGQLDDLAAIQRDIAQTRATLAANIDNRNTAIRSLQALMGHYPGGQLILDYNMPALIAPPQAGVPATLLSQRPDLRAGWQRVLAADESVKVAHKDMFPSLNLTSSVGTQSPDFSDLLTGASIWSLASRLTLPLFNARQLENNMHAAQSRAEQAWIRYLQSTLNAFREVERALDRETLLSDQEARQAEAVVHAKNTAGISTDRYRNGLISILEYLNAQNAVFDSKGRLLNVRNKRLQNRVALALALGKGV